MRITGLIQSLGAVLFGLWFLALGIYGFVRTENSERRIQEKLQSIRAGSVQSETLTVVKKYVNPGKGGLGHIVFSSAEHSKVDIPATVDFFNGLSQGSTVRAYHFSDGYFIPENVREVTGAGKWFLLTLGCLMGGAALFLARATARSRNNRMPIR